jgi:hypothetical protein
MGPGNVITGAAMVVPITGGRNGRDEDDGERFTELDGASSSSSGFNSSEISTLAEDMGLGGGRMRIICASAHGMGILFRCAFRNGYPDRSSTTHTHTHTHAQKKKNKFDARLIDRCDGTWPVILNTGGSKIAGSGWRLEVVWWRPK